MRRDYSSTRLEISGVIILISLTLTADTEYKHHPHHPITQASQAVDVVKAALCVLLALCCRARLDYFAFSFTSRHIDIL